MVRPSFDSPDTLAVALLRSSGFSAEPPTAVFQLARRLGASHVVEGDIGPDDGRLGVRDDRVVITVNADATLERKRFTVAHEAAHLLLARSDLDLSRLRARPPFDDDERFCDRLAESLLMPA